MLRIFGLITLISLSFIQFAFIENANGEPVGSPELKWIEDGEILPLNWRSNSTWVWKGQSLALQMYLEVPENIAQKLPKTIERVNSSSSTPLKVQPGYVLTLLHLSSPSKIITISDAKSSMSPQDVREPSVRAIRIDVPYEKTTWMRHASCQPYKVFLEEKTRAAKGPFFISLFCDEAGDAVSVRIGQSDEAEFDVSALHEGKIAGKLVKFTKTQKLRSYRALAMIRSNINGEQVSAYELAADFQPAAPLAEGPAPLAAAENRISLGVSLQRTSADKSDFGNGQTEVRPTLSFESQFGKGNWNLVLDLPVEQLSSTTSASTLATLRVLKEASSTQNWKFAWGLHAYRLLSSFSITGGQSMTQSEIGYSPAVAATYSRSEKSLQAQIVLAPFDFRSKMPFATLDLTRLVYEAEESRWKLVASGFTGGRNLGGNSEWNVHGFAIGVRGEL